MKLKGIRIVLVRPEQPANVGAVARVMANFGLDHLVLVSPGRWLGEAGRLAKGAEDILEGADVVGELREAVGPCARAWATTRRAGRKRIGGRDPEDAGQESAELSRSGQLVAWVFGPESRGLTTAEVALCSGRVTISTSPKQPSLNLAQAAAVCCYETYRHALGRPEGRLGKEAALSERHAMYAHLEASLLSLGFLHPQTAEVRMATIRALFERARLTAREVRLLRGLAQQVGWLATKHPPASRRTGSSSDPRGR